ncbi:spore gernimation protein GerD [Salipaludibacillus agaradhaerens]|uniref:spore germination lipoprotein GerD n=1 Tax=Salipaludibacillus agaradhaerens TaxID=76935 RepID=UPI002150E0E9|nr:spore germination lipoprotein GerD [Salipaludibacillus agaradhaerens]MCR6104928.1 spore gernimation protein GerD [Salipaludibacillus agaradhaerens]MCR6116975.1 spore gernimation protein GerD [Salipaludibacillus agaradhaerens]UJW56170.1 spore gernimation protein GerD [Bacillus sp. A116_S68]
MRRYSAMIFFIILSSLFASACTVTDDQGQQADYEATKQMVVDVLQTEEGKKAVQEVVQDEEIQEQLIMEQDFIKETIQTTLASEEGQEYWQEIMKDPEFAKTFAESMQEENENLLKGLMKDPEYQSMMLDIMKDPEMEQNYVELMETKDYREQVRAIVTEAMESPLFVARLNELLQQMAKEELQSGEAPDNGGGEGQEGDQGDGGGS